MKFKTLFAMEMAKFRDQWIWSILLSSLFPLSFLFFLKEAEPSLALYAVSGGFVFSLVLNAILAMSQELSYLKEAGALDYYATLSIGKLSLLAAILARSLLFALPSLATISFFSSYAFGISIFIHPFGMLMTLALGLLSLSGLGVFLGLSLPNSRTVNIMSQAVYLVIVFGSPVFVPQTALPIGLRQFSWVLPTTYLAEALRGLMDRALLAGNFYAPLFLLFLFCPLSMALAYKAMKRA